MAVASKKPPKGKSKSAEQQTESAWKYNDDGTKTRSSRLLPYESKLRELLTTAAGGMRLAAHDDFAANAILGKTDELAYGYAKLAKENPEVKKVLDFIFSTSALAEAVIPTSTLALMLAWHYGFFVPDKIGGALALANGIIPESREVEVERKRAETQREANRDERSGDSD